MTRPTVFLIRMIVFLVLVTGVTGLLAGELVVAFTANPFLNAVIAAVLLGGVFWNIRQVVRLAPEVRWLETFQRNRTSLAALPTPKLLAPMVSMLAARDQRRFEGGRADGGRLTISSQVMRSTAQGAVLSCAASGSSQAATRLASHQFSRQ